MKKNRGIDLFAGIGGFHLAAKKNDIEIIFASEIDEDAIKVYEENHKLKVSGDITKINEKDIGTFEWLFAGFPCQAFSVGGHRKGFEDTRGTLFFDVARIAKEKQPKFILLENVKGLLSHDKGNTWKTILLTLDQIGYKTTEEPVLLSPNDLGVPQRRPRVFIPCIRKDIAPDEFKINIKYKNKKTNLVEYWGDKDFTDDLKLSVYHNKVLDAWEDFKDNIYRDKLCFSIWSEYWGKDEKILKKEPKWKHPTIIKNINLYKEKAKELSDWMERYDIDSFYPTHRKFEWSVGENLKFNEVLIQFRPSGIRAVNPFLHPTLTTIINQTAIIAKDRRKISIDEAKELQCFPKKMKLFDNYGKSVKQLGNAVNVKVVSEIIKEMKKYEK